MHTILATCVISLLALTTCLVSPAAAVVQQAHQASALPDLPPILLPGEQDVLVPPQKPKVLDFTLRHIFHHGTHKYPDLHRRLDVPKDASIWATADDSSSREPVPKLLARPQTFNIERLADRRQESIDAILDAGRMQGRPVALDASAWTIDEIAGPNVTDKETVLSMARIAANAYVLDHDEGEWREVGGGFNYTEDFGWQTDGLRGHIFADTENSTVVIGIKGTSPAVFDGSETTTNDKINDNLFFSCCCGQGGQYSWRQVCDCQTSAYKCNSTCVVQALRNKNRYYYAGQEIYRNVSKIYPDADIWLVGHSLGGSTSSLVALTYGIPVVTFEAPGEAMPASRLGLPTPPGYHLGSHQQRAMTGGWHFGHTADPMFMGTCNTFSSVCTIAGYAMQSRCHTGLTCAYDTVGDLGWRSSSSTHRIQSVINDVLEKYDEPAECKPMSNCTDCYNWEYYESNHTDTTTSSSSTSTSTTSTRTSTCKTPGWWGCLDEETTTTASSRTTPTTSITTTTSTQTTTTTTTTTTTSTCETPGWFGCKDPTSVTSGTAPAPVPTLTPSITTATSSGSTTCKSPGWWGCNDPVSTSTDVRSATVTRTITSTTVTTDASRTSTMVSSPPSSGQTSSCTSHKWFGLICADDPRATATGTGMPSPKPSPDPPGARPTSKHCVRRSLIGLCKEWRWDGEDGEWKLDL